MSFSVGAVRRPAVSEIKYWYAIRARDKSKQKSITSLENVTAFPSRLAAAAALDRRYWLSLFGFSLFGCFVGLWPVGMPCSLGALWAGWLADSHPVCTPRDEARMGLFPGLVLFDVAFCCAVEISIRVVERSGEG